MMHKGIKTLLIFCLLLCGCKSQNIEKTKPKKATKELSAEQKLDQKVNQWIDSYGLEEQVLQMFMITPEALTGSESVTVADDSFKASLEQYPVGGLIFFAQNLENPDQTRNLLSTIQSDYSQMGLLAPFFSVDEEGGVVARIGNNPNFGVDQFGPMWDIGQSQDSQQAYDVGKTIGTYLHDYGFNMDMAPDADVLSNLNNTVIGTRSFGSDPQLVSQMVHAEVEGFQSTHVEPVIKHFPGHGGTLGDTHEGFAYTDKSLDQLKECELIPFQNEINQGIQMIMVSHISVPNVLGDNTPSSLSSVMVQDLLRDQMYFDGIVITDGLDMGAIVNAYDSATAAVMAIQAGDDILLMPENFSLAYQGVLDAVNQGVISKDRIETSVRRILRYKYRNLV